MSASLATSRTKIPPASSGTKRPNSSTNDSNSDLDMLLWRLRARTEANEDLGTLIGITSCGPKSGVSTLATNLAIRASMNHLGPVLLIDANINAPRLHRIFRKGGKVGLIDLLVGSSTPDEAFQRTSADDLDLLPLGSKETLRSARILPGNYSDFATWIREHYRTVFIDLPSIESMRYALMLARLTDTTIVAIRSEAIRRSQVVAAIERLSEDGVKIGGTVLTRRRIYTPRWFRYA